MKKKKSQSWLNPDCSGCACERVNTEALTLKNESTPSLPEADGGRSVAAAILQLHLPASIPPYFYSSNGKSYPLKKEAIKSLPA